MCHLKSFGIKPQKDEAALAFFVCVLLNAGWAVPRLTELELPTSVIYGASSCF
jgi:hypothetical protein